MIERHVLVLVLLAAAGCAVAAASTPLRGRLDSIGPDTPAGMMTRRGEAIRQRHPEGPVPLTPAQVDGQLQRRDFAHE